MPPQTSYIRVLLLACVAACLLGASPTTTPAPLPGDDVAPELMLFNDLPVVVAAEKREQRQEQAPASVSVVDANDIQLFNYRSLADVLRDQRGFYLQTDGLNWFAGVRGFSRPGEWNARLLVLVDGRPTRDAIFGQSHLDKDFVVPLEAVKQVEIVRGPGSALYGSNAVFGVIGLVTKDGADVHGVEVKAEAGTQDTYRGNVLFGEKFPGGWDVLADFSGYTSQGDHDIHFDGVHDAAHNFGVIDHGDYEGVDAGFIKVRNGDFLAEFDFETRQKGNRDATYLASFFDPGSMHEQRGNVMLRFDHEVAEGQSLHAMAYYGHYNYNQVIPLTDDGFGHPVRYYTTAEDAWVGQEIHYDWQVTKKLHLLFGADATEALYTHQRDHDTINGVVLDVPASFNQWALFTEGDFRISDQLSLTAGVRMDQVQRIGTSISPRFAAIFTPTPQDTFKLLYGRAFRDPNLYELLYSDPGTNVANPGLKPEVIDTYEFAWERLFRSGWHTSLNAFVWRMHDSLENVTLADGTTQTQNAETLWAHGGEAEIMRRWETGLQVRSFATFTVAEHDGSRLTHSPQWIVGGAVAVPVINARTFIAIEPQIVGPMKSDLGQYTRATFLTNVVFTSREFVKGWTFQAGAYNLFANSARLPRADAGDQFEPTLNYPSTQFLASLTYKF